MGLADRVEMNCASGDTSGQRRSCAERSDGRYESDHECTLHGTGLVSLKHDAEKRAEEGVAISASTSHNAAWPQISVTREFPVGQSRSTSVGGSEASVLSVPNRAGINA